MKNNYELIIFDFDGVIADTFEIFTRALNQFYYSKEKKYITNKEIGMLRDMTALEIIKHFKFSPFMVMTMHDCLNKKMKEDVEKLKIQPKVRDVLEKISQIKKKEMGVVSSNNQNTIENFLDNNRANFFSFIYCRGHLLKKHKNILKAIKLKKVEKENVLMIGDEARDIEAAKKAGIDVVAITSGYNSKKVLKKYRPDYLLDNFEDILGIISEK